MSRIRYIAKAHFFALLLPLLSAACSVGMAASGHKEQDTTVIFPGSTRAVIISKLGPPETSRKLEDGKMEDSYLIKKGNEASSGRAWAHAGLDLLSLGLWEVVATPYELAQGEERMRMFITYDAAGTVVDVQQGGSQLPQSLQPAQSSPSVNTPTPSASANAAADIGDRLNRLNDLRNKSLITPQEYDAKRAEILNGM